MQKLMESIKDRKRKEKNKKMICVEMIKLKNKIRKTEITKEYS